MNYLLVRCSNKIIYGVNNLFKGTLKKFKNFLLGHKILKSTSVDCNKINVVMVMVRIMMWESPGNSHTIAIQWVHMVKDPPATILLVHTVTSKYTLLLSIMIGI